ncbi:MAG: hypothetical protein CR982_09500 [Candidatus Cloacimonadota bacterium]|nr:MAG: hypothetical protein CR982_09500 [Candidatus Cloacimonadota bacterium]PIE79274.1 MAG: hypothetical protein CSA15_03675 [Candidatus Delongbacteria bacterium]
MRVELDKIREQIIGNNLVFETPFGKRNLFYADYTASGRSLKLVEEYMLKVEEVYANSHTEDDFSGKSTTDLLHIAEEKIKKFVNAGKNGKIISIGSGATGALKRLQEILGVYIPPVAKDIIYKSLEDFNCSSCDVIKTIEDRMPVVFIGPYEHHSNEVMWRESFAEVVVVNLGEDGLIDLDDFRKKISDPKYSFKKKLVSISAGSNITGTKSEVYGIAKIAHEYKGFVFYDFAAVAPYVKIDMNKDKDSFFDAIFFSPHKFLGGPGSSGVLIFNERIYQKDLPPTTPAGGTVDYVGYLSHDFTEDIESREKGGTPPILQTIRTALVMELKEIIGIENIEKREEEYCKYFFNRYKDSKKLQIIGPDDPNLRVPIISFNILHGDRIVHPKLVTKLLNDIFGIQSRAGCSCAGPYGHTLLNIEQELSESYRKYVKSGKGGLKPGWVRVNLHYTFNWDDVKFLCDAIDFVCDHVKKYISVYDFDFSTGDWIAKGWKNKELDTSLEFDFNLDYIPFNKLSEAREQYFKEVNELVYF